MTAPHHPPTPGRDADEGSLFTTLLRLLRGRHVAAAVLAGLGLCVGATAGYLWVQPTYRSTAMLQMSPSETAILYSSADDRRMADFEGYMDTQLIFLRGEAVSLAALQHPYWAQAKPAPEPGLNAPQFQSRVDAERQKGKQIIQVSFEHEQPELALAGVRAIVNAFEDSFNADREHELSIRREQIKAQLAQQREKQSDLKVREQMTTGNLEVSDLEQLIAIKQAKVEEWDQTLLELRAASERTEIDASGVDLAGTGNESADPMLRQYTRVLEQVKMDIINAARFGENHLEYRRLVELREGLQGSIDARRRVLAEGSAPPVAGAIEGSDEESPSVASVGTKPREQAILQLRNALDAEVAKLRKQRSELHRLDDEAATIGAVIETARGKLHELDVESQRPSRLRIVDDGGPPNMRHMGKRRLQAAALGGCAGAAGGLGLIMLLGWFDRKVRNFSDVSDQLPAMRVLGLVPSLPDFKKDAHDERTLNAAMTIHEIRSQLQRPRDNGHGQVLTLISAGPGAGKTTLSMALAMSFGHSGAKTLLMDLDFLGQGVSSRGGPPGSSPSPRKGVIDALEGAPLKECCFRGAARGIWVMPVGDASIYDVGQLSRETIGKLIRRLRGVFDVVIVDSGPVLGSIECGLVMPEADDVVLVIARGESRDDTHAAIAKSGAYIPQLTGVIYNLAADDDYKGYRSSIGSRMSQRDQGERLIQPLSTPSPETEHYGPVAYATASFLHGGRHRSNGKPPRMQVNGSGTKDVDSHEIDKGL